MVGSVICQKPEEVMTVRVPSRCSERRECSQAHSGIARKGNTAKVQTLGLNLITFATEKNEIRVHWIRKYIIQIKLKDKRPYCEHLEGKRIPILWERLLKTCIQLACPPPHPSFLPEDEYAEGKGLGPDVPLLLVPDTYCCHCLTK